MSQPNGHLPKHELPERAVHPSLPRLSLLPPPFFISLLPSSLARVLSLRFIISSNLVLLLLPFASCAWVLFVGRSNKVVLRFTHSTSSIPAHPPFSFALRVPIPHHLDRFCTLSPIPACLPNCPSLHLPLPPNRQAASPSVHLCEETNVNYNIIKPRGRVLVTGFCGVYKMICWFTTGDTVIS